MNTTRIRTSGKQRRLSKRVFNSNIRVEVGLAIGELDETFIFEELWDLVQEIARESGVEPPSESHVRNDVTRLREDLGVLERLPRAHGARIQHEVRKPSAFWALCGELSEQARQG